MNESSMSPVSVPVATRPQFAGPALDSPAVLDVLTSVMARLTQINRINEAGVKSMVVRAESRRAHRQLAQLRLILTPADADEVEAQRIMAEGRTWAHDASPVPASFLRGYEGLQFTSARKRRRLAAEQVPTPAEVFGPRRLRSGQANAAAVQAAYLGGAR